MIAVLVAYGAVSPDSSLVLSSAPTWGPLVKMVLVLIVVLALIWITLSLLKRVMGMRSGGAAAIELIGGVSLGPKKSLQFVKVGSKLHLIGSTEHTINLITTIEDPAEIQRIAGTATPPAMETFGTLIKKIRDRGAKK